MAKDKDKQTILQPNIILCEGEDTIQFIIQYLLYLQKQEKHDARFDNFQAFNFGGNNQLSLYLSDIRSYSGFDRVISMTIIRDSECNYVGAMQSVKSALEKAGYPVPTEPNHIVQDDKMRVAFSLFPSLSNCKRDGTLEDLYIENLKEDGVETIITDIMSFLCDLESKGRTFKWLHKTSLHTYFSVTDKYVSKKIGQATEAGAFNFECAEMNSLKRLLENIAL